MEAKVGLEGDMDSLKATELRLGPPGTTAVDEPQKPAASRGSKRSLQAAGDQEQEAEESSSGRAAENGEVESAPSPTKAQVVGWPPIRSFRKNCLQAATKSTTAEAEAPAGAYVKVSMDGAPYLRKVDLQSYGGYRELRQAMEAMFRCFSAGTEGCSSSESYVIAYEDKDGDWMLAGDVPWEMFAWSCRRLRIMRGSEARGLGSSKNLIN